LRCSCPLSHLKIAIICGLTLCIGCQNTSKSDKLPQDLVIATVGLKELRSSTVDQVLHSYASHEDSLALATAYVDNWIRDQLMMKEALDRFSEDIKVNRLVEDYKGRLLKHHLELAIINERFDTLITDAELNEYYEKVKTQFSLNEPIVKCTFVKFNKDTKSLSEFYKDWRADEDHAVRTFAAAYGDEVSMDTSIWRPVSELKTWYSGFSERVILQKRPQRQLDAESQYYLKVVDVMDKGTFSPLAYIKPQLERMLLHQRRQAIIGDYKQELYERGISKGIIKI